MKFKILAGQHQSGSKRDGTLQRYAARDRHTGLYRTDPDFGTDLPDEIETELDLVKRFVANKFELIED